METPDYWNDYDKSKAVSRILNIDYENNEPFTTGEIQRVMYAINQLEIRMISELNLNADQTIATKKAIDSLDAPSS
jgi:hypothetical protein